MSHLPSTQPDPIGHLIFAIFAIGAGITTIIKPDIFFKSWANQQKFFGLTVTPSNRYFMWQRVGGVGLILVGLISLNSGISQAVFGFIHTITLGVF